MRILLISVGKGMPDWVAAGFREYARRLPRQCSLELVEVAPCRRGKNTDKARIKKEEGSRLLARVPPAARVVALDEGGEYWATRQLAQHLREWLRSGRDVVLLVGGADGLDTSCIHDARDVWSLSPLTLPHMLIRVLVAEQIYRAWSIVAGHPYHRD